MSIQFSVFLVLPLSRWTWVWASSRSWWWPGKPGVLQSTGSQSERHDWQTELSSNPSVYYPLTQMFLTHWSIFDIDYDPCVTLKTASMPHKISKSINVVSVLKNTLAKWQEQAYKQLQCTADRYVETDHGKQRNKNNVSIVQHQ